MTAVRQTFVQMCCYEYSRFAESWSDLFSVAGLWAPTKCPLQGGRLRMLSRDKPLRRRRHRVRAHQIDMRRCFASSGALGERCDLGDRCVRLGLSFVCLPPRLALACLYSQTET